MLSVNAKVAKFWKFRAFDCPCNKDGFAQFVYLQKMLTILRKERKLK